MPQQYNILVVEDDNDSKEALCTILEGLGYTPISYSSGQSAIGDLSERPQEIHLAMLDIMMPNMNGYELLQELRKIDSYKEIPVIMVTAKDADSEILDGYKYGADYYITKPYTTKQIEYGIKLYLS